MNQAKKDNLEVSFDIMSYGLKGVKNWIEE